MSKRLLSNEEVDYLADCYIRLQKDRTYQKLSKTFQDYINDFLDKELLAIKKIGGEKCLD